MYGCTLIGKRHHECHQLHIIFLMSSRFVLDTQRFPVQPGEVVETADGDIVVVADAETCTSGKRCKRISDEALARRRSADVALGGALGGAPRLQTCTAAAPPLFSLVGVRAAKPSGGGQEGSWPLHQVVKLLSAGPVATFAATELPAEKFVGCRRPTPSESYLWAMAAVCSLRCSHLK